MNNGGSDGRESSQGSSEGTLPLDDVGRLVELLAESGAGEIRVRQGELEITVKARIETRAEPPANIHVGPPAATPAREEVFRAPQVASGGDVPAELRDLHLVCSPVVGTFYRTPTPGEEPYVEVGDRVDEGQTLCIVEAMKLMNEIPADESGEVVEILAENAKGVEYDQPLFRIRPDS